MYYNDDGEPLGWDYPSEDDGMAYASHEPTDADYFWEDCVEQAIDQVYEQALALIEGDELPACFEPDGATVEALAEKLFEAGMASMQEAL